MMKSLISGNWKTKIRTVTTMTVLRKFLFLFAGLVLVGAMILPATMPVKAAASWYDTDWQYRKSKTIGASEVVSDYTVTGGATPLRLHTGNGTDNATDLYFNGKCKDYFDDIRVTEDDGETLLNYALRSANQTDAELCVKTSVGASPTTIYIYYGNSDACRYADGFSTFIGYEGSLFVDNIGNNDDTYHDNYCSGIKLHDGTLAVIWRRGTAMGECQSSVMFSTSSSQGRIWSAASAIMTADAANQYGIGSISEYYNSTLGMWQIMVCYAHAPIPANASDRLYLIWSVDGGTSWGNNSPDFDNSTGTIVVDAQRLNFNPAIQLTNTKSGEDRARLLLPLHDTSYNCYAVMSTDFFASWSIITMGQDAVSDSCEPAFLELKDSGAFTSYVYCLVRNNANPYGYDEIISSDYGDTWGTNSPDFDDGNFTASGLTSNAAEKGHIFRMNDGTAIAVYCPLAGADDGEIRVVKASVEDKDITWDTTNYALPWRSRDGGLGAGDYAYATLCNITSDSDSQIGVFFCYGTGNNAPPSYVAFTWVESGSFVGTQRFSHSATAKLTSLADSLLLEEATASNNAAIAYINPSVTKYYIEGRIKTTSQGAADQNGIAGADDPATALSWDLYIPQKSNQTKIQYVVDSVFNDLYTSYTEGTTYRFKTLANEDDDKCTHWFYDDSWSQLATSGEKDAPNLPANEMEQIRLGSFSSSGQAYSNWYWITVRKYTATEPAWGLTGVEEEPPTPPPAPTPPLPVPDAGVSLLRSVLRVALASAIIIGVIQVGRVGGIVAMLVSAVVGIAAFVIVDQLISIL